MDAPQTPAPPMELTLPAKAPTTEWMAEALLVVIAVALTWPVLAFGFVLHDDGLEIAQNPLFYPFDGSALRRIWSAPDFSHIYIPASYTVLGALTQLSRWWQGVGPMDGPAAAVFHAAGIMLHTLNAVLVFRLLRRALGGGSVWAPFGGALLFAVHPAQVESYARAGNVTVTLGALWALLALGAFLRSLERTRGAGWWAAAAFLFFALGLLTRPGVAALPVAAWVLAWTPGLGKGRALALRLAPWAVVAVAYTGLTLYWQPAAFDAGVAGGRWWERPAIAADSLAWYAAQALWPSSLAIDHGRTPQAVMASPTVWLSLAGVVAALVALAILGRAAWRWKLEVAGIVMFAVLLAPVSGLVPAANRETVSIVYDRHLYLPLLGLALASAALLRRVSPERRLWVVLPAALLLAVLSRNYQRAWRDSIVLFNHAVRVNPGSWYAHGQLGTAWYLAGRPAEAVPLLARSVALNPHHADTRVNLGQALLDCGRHEEAEPVLRSAVSLAPTQANARNSLAVALLRRNAWEEAEAEARTALRLDASHPLAMTNLALAQSGQGLQEEALAQAQKAADAHPRIGTAWMALSEILRAAGKGPEAREALERACALEPLRQDWRAMLNTEESPPEAANPPPHE